MDYLLAVSLVWMNGYLVYLVFHIHQKHPEEMDGKLILLLVMLFAFVNGTILFGIPDPRVNWIIAALFPFGMMLGLRANEFYHNLPSKQLARRKKEEEDRKREIQALYEVFGEPESYATLFTERFINSCLGRGFIPPPPAVLQTIRSIVAQLFAADFRHPTTKLPNAHIQTALLTKTVSAQHILGIFDDHLLECLVAYAHAFPRDRDGFILVPVTTVMDVAGAVRDMFHQVWTRSHKLEYGLFEAVHAQIIANYWRVMRSELPETAIAEGKRIDPSSFRGHPFVLVQHYCAGTPFLPLFQVDVPLPIEKQRFEHQFVIAPSG